MLSTKLKKLLCVLLAVLMIFGMAGCMPRHIDLPSDEIPEDTESYKDDKGRINLAVNNTFSHGFTANAPGTPVFEDLALDGYSAYGRSGNLLYNQYTKNPVWSVSQHASAYSLADPKYNTPVKTKLGEDADGKDIVEYRFSTPGSSLTVIPKKKSINLMVKGSNEYSYDDNHDGIRDGMRHQPRTSGSQPWVHLLLESTLANPENPSSAIVRVRDASKLEFEVDLTMTQHDKAWDNSYAAQLQMYFMIYTDHPADKGQYFWLGLSMFDSRYSFTSAGLPDGWMFDNGTASWMYGVNSHEVLGDSGVFQVGKKYQVRVDIMKHIVQGLAKTQQGDGHGNQQMLTNSTLVNLYICDFNLGWELTGAYDAAVTFENFCVWMTPKATA